MMPRRADELNDYGCGLGIVADAGDQWGVSVELSGTTARGFSSSAIS